MHRRNKKKSNNSTVPEERLRKSVDGLNGVARSVRTAVASLSCGIPLNRVGLISPVSLHFLLLPSFVPATPEHVSVDRFRSGYAGGRNSGAQEKPEKRTGEIRVPGSELANGASMQVGKGKKKRCRRNEIVK